MLPRKGLLRVRHVTSPHQGPPRFEGVRRRFLEVGGNPHVSGLMVGSGNGLGSYPMSRLG
ncbi:hypothetical protein ThrDRAFT_02005 [Frankia casuarinae]|nr:hypothetical protein ThrDRAFT_02005 [Frankia casuarinae]OAA28989.1 hypothetical protein AAY23_1018154 [Frankia casuarinae]